MASWQKLRKSFDFMAEIDASHLVVGRNFEPVVWLDGRNRASHFSLMTGFELSSLI